MKPIHKLNNGRGATLCHTCSVIITTGLTKDLYCEKCKPKQERSYSEEEVLDILIKAMKEVKVKQLTFFDGGSEYPIYSNLSKWFERFKKK